MDKPISVSYSTDPYTPKDKSIVGVSPRFNEIIDKILMGWTPRAVSNWLVESYSEHIPEHAIYRYIKKYINPLFILPKGYTTKLRALLRNFEGSLSAREGIRSLILAQETRVGELLHRETEIRKGNKNYMSDPNNRQFKGYFDSRVRHEMELLYNMYRDEVGLEVALGRIKDAKGDAVDPQKVAALNSKNSNFTNINIIKMQKVLNILENDTSTDKETEEIPRPPKEFVDRFSNSKTSPEVKVLDDVKEKS